jgi:hypothetical protein
VTTDPSELAGVVAAVVDALTASNVPYFITGSLASSVHGDFRATNDVDIVADFRLGDLRAAVAELSRAFVVDQASVTDALRRSGSFNLIHLGSYLKFDVFAAAGEFEQSALSRRVLYRMPGTSTEFAFASVEDILLAKLRWYDAGGPESSVQWRDITRLIALNRPQLDADYLHRWAASMRLTDLLARAEGP